MNQRKSLVYEWISIVSTTTIYMYIFHSINVYTHLIQFELLIFRLLCYIQKYTLYISSGSLSVLIMCSSAIIDRGWCVFFYIRVYSHSPHLFLLYIDTIFILYFLSLSLFIRCHFRWFFFLLLLPLLNVLVYWIQHTVRVNIMNTLIHNLFVSIVFNICIYMPFVFECKRKKNAQNVYYQIWKK